MNSAGEDLREADPHAPHPAPPAAGGHDRHTRHGPGRRGGRRVADRCRRRRCAGPDGAGTGSRSGDLPPGRGDRVEGVHAEGVQASQRVERSEPPAIGNRFSEPDRLRRAVGLRDVPVALDLRGGALRGVGLGFDPVRLGRLDEADCGDMAVALEPGLSQTVTAIHQLALRIQDHRIGEVGVEDPPRMTRHLADAGGMAALEPAIEVELGDLGQRDLLDGQVGGQGPEALRPPVAAPAGHGAGMFFVRRAGHGGSVALTPPPGKVFRTAGCALPSRGAGPGYWPSVRRWGSDRRRPGRWRRRRPRPGPD